MYSSTLSHMYLPVDCSFCLSVYTFWLLVCCSTVFHAGLFMGIGSLLFPVQPIRWNIPLGVFANATFRCFVQSVFAISEQFILINSKIKDLDPIGPGHVASKEQSLTKLFDVAHDPLGPCFHAVWSFWVQIIGFPSQCSGSSSQRDIARTRESNRANFRSYCGGFLKAVALTSNSPRAPILDINKCQICIVHTSMLSSAKSAGYIRIQHYLQFERLSRHDTWKEQRSKVSNHDQYHQLATHGHCPNLDENQIEWRGVDLRFNSFLVAYCSQKTSNRLDGFALTIPTTTFAILYQVQAVFLSSLRSALRFIFLLAQTSLVALVNYFPFQKL